MLQHFPADVVEDMRMYRSRGGAVKINAALSAPPRYENVTDAEADMLRIFGLTGGSIFQGE